MPDWKCHQEFVRLNWVAKLVAALKRLKTTGLNVLLHVYEKPSKEDPCLKKVV